MREDRSHEGGELLPGAGTNHIRGGGIYLEWERFTMAAFLGRVRPCHYWHREDPST